LVAILAAAGTVAGARVYRSRMGPAREVDLPCLCVYVDSEVVEEDPTAPPELVRTVDVVVEGYAAVAHDVDLEAALDALALQVETAVDTADSLSGTVDSIVLASTEIGVRPEGQRPTGAVRLTYRAVYHTDFRKPAPADALDTLDVQYSLSGAQAPADRAEDLLDGIYAS
jgi:hypothetical protein